MRESMNVLERCEEVSQLRKAVSSESPIDEALHDRASRVLGYGIGRRQTSKVTNERIHLQAIVEACDATRCPRPFTRSSVEAYKRLMAPDDTASYVMYTAAVIMTAMGLVVTAVMSVWLLQFALGAVADAHAHNARWVVTVLAVAVSLVVASQVVLRRSTRLRMIGNEWIECDIDAYSAPIPEFVLQTACDVTEELRRRGTVGVVQMRIAYLARRRAFSNDPFLFVVTDSCRAYLEVWDEPSYRAQRVR